MRLLFTGTTPAWFIVMAFLAASAATVMVYRRYNLQRPWSVVLPACRILAFALLLLTLFQPVLARIWQTRIRGRIPVVIDTSGSMSIRDDYSPAEQLAAAWNLGLFPRNLRCLTFEELAQEARDVTQQLTAWTAQTGTVIAPLALEQPLQEKAEGALKKQRRGVRELQRTVERLQRAAMAAADDHAYLEQPPKPSETRGHATYERYDDIAGWEVGDLTAATEFPDRPNAGRHLSALALPANCGESYGARVRAFLHPPQTGAYVFMLAADDQAELFLSTDERPEQKRLIARATEWTAPGDYGQQRSQTTDPVSLEEGKAYYLEVLFKENLGADHCTVAWVRPDGTPEDPVPGDVLSPLHATPALMAFRQHLAEFDHAAGAAAERLGGLEQALEALIKGKDQAARTEALKRIGQDLVPVVAAWRAQPALLDALQNAADATLAGAGLPRVDSALARFWAMERVDIARYLLTDKALNVDKLKRIGEVDLFSLDEPVHAQMDHGEQAEASDFAADLPATRLGSVVHDAVTLYGKQPVAAVVLLSDGNSNSGKSLPELRQFMAEKDIPLFAVGVGRPTPPRDVSIERVLGPSTSFRGDKLHFNVVLRRYGYENRPITVRVSSGGEPIHEQTVEPGTESVLALDMAFVEELDGMRHYEVEAEPFPNEVLEINNRKTVSVNILTDPVQALLVDEFPRWESRYANMMLERDQRIEVSTVFVASVPGGELPAGAGGFPQTRDELFAYHLLVLGDVNPEHFTAAQFEAIESFVVEKGGTLLLMAGDNFMPEAYRSTPLGDILPFKVQPRPLQAADRLPAEPHGSVSLPLAVTEAGRYESPVQIGSTPDLSAELWAGLPGMNWVRPGVFPVQNAEILVASSTDELPVMVTALVGLGKVMYLGTDSLWRWRYRARWKYHHRLWGQVLLWATVGRTSGRDEHVKLMTDRPEYSPGETVTLKARVLDRERLPLEGGTVSAEIVDSTGETLKNVRFTHLPNSGGEYRALLKDLPKGRYTAVPRVLELENVDIEADYPFEIRDLPTSEYIELALDAPALREIATEYRHFLRAGEILDKIPEIERTEEHRREIEIWDTLPLLAAVAALLGFEWQMRKRQNLV